MFMVLSLWHCHYGSSPGSFDECSMSTEQPPIFEQISQSPRATDPTKPTLTIINGTFSHIAIPWSIEGWVNWDGLSHPSTNRARRTATSLTWLNMLPVQALFYAAVLAKIIQGLSKTISYLFQTYSCDILPGHIRHFWNRTKNLSHLDPLSSIKCQKKFKILFGFQKLSKSWKNLFQ